MSLSIIYKHRFSDIKSHQSIWKILVNGFFQQFINKADTVLDVGCGYGEFINHVHCRKKVAIDLNPDSRKYLNKKVKFFLGSSAKMDFIKTASADKIFVSNFFEHLSREDIVKTIREFRRILQKRGEALILQPNIRFLEKDYWMFFDHLTPIDDRALEEIFTAHGFQLKKRILKFLPYTTKSRYPKSPWLVKLYLKLPLIWPLFGKQSFLIFKKK